MLCRAVSGSDYVYYLAGVSTLRNNSYDRTQDKRYMHALLKGE